MDVTAVVAAVEEALVKFSAKNEETSHTSLPNRLREIVLVHESSKGVEHVLSAQEEFAHAPMISSLGGGMGFSPQFVAPMLLREARIRGVSRAVEWLQKVLGTKSARGIAIYTLRGVRVDRSASLTKDVDLVPFESLPDSRQKEGLSTPALAPYQTVPLYAFGPPSSALVTPVEITPYLVNSASVIPPTSRADLYVRFEDIRHCLALSRSGAVIPGPSWFQYDDPDLEAALLGSSSSFGHQEVVPLVLVDDGGTDLQQAIDTVSGFYALEDGVRHRVRTAMERVHLAFIRSSPADRALELAIALETLLVESSGENTFKIALRAALLTGDDVQTRATNRAIIGAAYGLRSALMHSGQSPGHCTVRGRGKVPAAEVAATATGITVAVIQRILRDRQLPDWNALELAGGTAR